jgi:hypothetical protein
VRGWGRRKKKAPKTREEAAKPDKEREAQRKAAGEQRKQEEADWQVFAEETIKKCSRPSP